MGAVIEKQSNFRNNSIIFITMTVCGSAINYLCQMLLGRFQSVETFATINTLFSFSVILSVPGTTLSMFIAKKSSLYYHEKLIIEYYIRKMLYLTAVILLTAIPVSLIFVMPMRAITHVEQPFIVFYFMLYTLIAYIPTAFTGLFTGLKHFAFAGSLSLFIPVFKLIGVIYCQAFNQQGEKTLIIIFFSMLIGALAAWAYVMYLLNRDHYHIGMRSIFSKSNRLKIRTEQTALFLCNLSIVLLSNIDILMISFLYPLKTVGMYSSVMLFGRIVYYIITSLVTVMLPSIVHLHSRPVEQFSLFITTCLYTLGLCALFFVPLVLLSDKALGVVFPADYLYAKQYMVPTCLIASTISLITVFLNFLASQNEEKSFLKIVVICLIILAVLTLLIHNNAMITLYEIIGMLLLCTLLSGILCLRKGWVMNKQELLRRN